MKLHRLTKLLAKGSEKIFLSIFEKTEPTEPIRTLAPKADPIPRKPH